MTEARESGQFGHHPDPAIDFCIEVEELEAIWRDRCNKFANPCDADLEARVADALKFRVGGDLHAINAKHHLRTISDEIIDAIIERDTRIRDAAPDLYEALKYITRWLMTDVDAEPPHINRDDVRVYHLDGAVLHNCLERARAALSKAEGASQ